MVKILGYVLFTILTISSCICQSQEGWIHSTFIDYEYEGIILRKFMDSANRTQPTVEFEYKGYTVVSNEVVFNSIEPGDHLIKRKGNTYSELIRKNTNDTIKFYEQCRGEDLK